MVDVRTEIGKGTYLVPSGDQFIRGSGYQAARDNKKWLFKRHCQEELNVKPGINCHVERADALFEKAWDIGFPNLTKVHQLYKEFSILLW